MRQSSMEVSVAGSVVGLGGAGVSRLRAAAIAALARRNLFSSAVSFARKIAIWRGGTGGRPRRGVAITRRLAQGK